MSPSNFNVVVEDSQPISVTVYNGAGYRPVFTVGFSDDDMYTCDGVADQVQIQQALTAAGDAGGGIVFLREGTYDIVGGGGTVDALDISDNTTVMGEGWGTILKVSAVALRVFHDIGGLTTQNQNIVIRDLQINGNYLARTGISIQKAKNMRIDNVYIHQIGTDQYSPPGSAAIVYNSEDIVISNCLIENSIRTAANEQIAGIWTASERAIRNIITNNTINNCWQGIKGDDFSGNGTIISGNTIRDCWNNGINYADFDEGVIEGNYVENCVGGIAFIFQTSGKNFVISNNIVFGCEDFGIFIKNSSGTAEVDGVVSGNLIRDTDGQGRGIEGQRITHVNITGNVSVDQTYGIYMHDLCDYINIQGNIVTGNSTAAISNVGDRDIVKNNIGYEVSDGWNIDYDTWVYVSANSFKITGKDVTARFPKGTRVSYNDGSVDYGVVVSSSFSTDTTVTLAANDDYAIANAALTAPRYSYESSPQGYPQTFNWTPTFTGFSADPSDAEYTFSINGGVATVVFSQTADGTSNATGFTASLPVAAKTVSANMDWWGACGFARDNSAALTTPAGWRVQSAASTVTFYKDLATGAWTGSGGKRIRAVVIYQI